MNRSKTDDESNNDPEPDGPTDSHILSQVDQDEKGLAQKAGETAEITNIGWGHEPDQIEEPLVAGLPNEDLWMLIRRFDKVAVPCSCTREYTNFVVTASVQSQDYA